MISSSGSLLAILQVHAFGHESLDVPFDVPIIVGFDGFSGGFIMTGADLDLVVVGEMALACDVSEKVRDVAEIWFLRTDTAVQRQLGVCHWREGEGTRRQRLSEEKEEAAMKE